jgi:tetratricopeptide (TPR) repeat protein
LVVRGQALVTIDLSKHGYPEALVILASLYSVQKRFSDAEPLAREAVQLDANSPEANQELARALYGLDRSEEAEPIAIEAARIEPKNPQTQLLLANIHLKLRNGPELIKNLDSMNWLERPTANQVRRMRQQITERLAEAASQETAPVPSLDLIWRLLDVRFSKN